MQDLSAATAPECLAVLIKDAVGTSDLLYVLYALESLADKGGLGLLPTTSHPTTGLTALEAAIAPQRNPRAQSPDEPELADKVRRYILRVLIVSGCRPSQLTPAASSALERATAFEDRVALGVFHEWDESHGVGSEWDDVRDKLARKVVDLEADLATEGLGYLAPKSEVEPAESGSPMQTSASATTSEPKKKKRKKEKKKKDSTRTSESDSDDFGKGMVVKEDIVMIKGDDSKEARSGYRITEYTFGGIFGHRYCLERPWHRMVIYADPKGKQPDMTMFHEISDQYDRFDYVWVDACEVTREQVERFNREGLKYS